MVDSKKKNKENFSNRKVETSTLQEDDKSTEEKSSETHKVANGLDGSPTDGKSHQLEDIIGCTEWQGQLVFLIKWMNEPDPQVVPAAIANIKYPQRVIQFYEKRIVWDQNK